MALTTRQTRILAAEDWKKIYQTFREADFMSYDFETLRKTMIDYLKLNYAEDFNDYIESSEFIALVDLIAFLGQSLAFRADLNARENFIDTAERRESILKLAKLISYNPKRNVPSSGFLKVMSVSTTQVVYDSDGTNLANQVITWNDLTNQNWYEQFITVVNSALISHQMYGRPSHSQNINNIKTDEYNINLVPDRLPIYKYNKLVNGQSTDFEIISATTQGKSYVYEVDPDINLPFNFFYRSDRNGNGSPNTGFFFYFKQGNLSSLDFEIAEMVSNKVVAVNVNNINNSDVWLYKLDDYNRIDTKWEQVQSTLGINVINNQLTNRNVYQINSLDNDQINLVFGDGTFGNIPLGKFRIFYRTSLGTSYKITPDDMSNVEITLDYVSRGGRVETLTVKAGLKHTVANASARESIADIKQKAPQNYYTQNRMVTGEDYNIFPYTAYENIKKIKAINRTSSGLSRYLDVLDTTGKYSSTNIFGQDGVLYLEKNTESFTINFETKRDVIRFINNKLIPDIIENDDIMHLYYENLRYKLFNLDGFTNDLLISEKDLLNDEFYEIVTVGTSDFHKYGSSSNTVGTFFYAKNAGNRDYNLTVSSVYNDLDTFYFTGDIRGKNPNIEVRSGDVIHFDLNLYNDNFHIKTDRTNGTSGNVTVGRTTNNGADRGRVSWDTTDVPPGTYYYTSRKYSGRCFDIDNFVNYYRKDKIFSVYRERAMAIMPLYLSNDQYNLSQDQIRFGFFKYPDHQSLSYWVDLSFKDNLDPRSKEFQVLFFSSADLIPGFTRHLTKNKLFDSTTGSNCGFANEPADWESTGMSGVIKVTAFGTGLVRTRVKWQLSTNDTGVATGYFAYNKKPVPIGYGTKTQFNSIVPRAMLKFVPESGKYFTQALSMVPGTPNTDDFSEVFASVQTIFGDGTNNGQGNFSNGVGPVTLNLPIPSGALLETLVPAYKNELSETLIDAITTALYDKKDFGLFYNVDALNWQMIEGIKLTETNWIVKFQYDSIRYRYEVSYRTLKYKFHSPHETNFYFNRDTLRYDPYYNRVNNDSIKILKSNGSPENQSKSLLRDLEWYVKSDVKRDDGFVENQYIYLTYGDSNQDSVPDHPNLFDQIVLGSPLRSTDTSIRAQQESVKINYNFKNILGRYPTQQELDSYVRRILSGESSLENITAQFSTLPEAVDYAAGIKTSKNLVFFEKTQDIYTSYRLLNKDKVITSFNSFLILKDNFRSYEVGQLFYCRQDDQFYQVRTNTVTGQKFLSDGLNNKQDSRVLPLYICYVGRQNLMYQYRHSADFTYRIDPSISNIIDLYVLTQEYDTSYRQYIVDSTNKIQEPVAPSNLDLAGKYTDLDKYKSVSDTVVLHSAVYKKLFGARADSSLQATFKVVKNPGFNISDAEIKTAVIAAVNEYFELDNWDFGESFFFSEFAAYLHTVLNPKIASIAILPKSSSYKYGSLYQINSEPYEILISVATVDDVEVVDNLSSLELQTGR